MPPELTSRGSPAHEARSRALGRLQRYALAGILLVGFGLRAACLAYAFQSPGYAWQDPDRYAVQARRLAGPDGWTWTFDAVTYAINAQRHVLPPGYSVFLSIFALFPGFPLTAQIAQVLLSVGAIGLVFALGRRVHSITSGLAAAAGFAVWVPNVLNVWSTSQETVYIPLILAGFLLFARALEGSGRPAAFALSGAVFGAAALTRSMPIFFIGPAVLVHVLMSRDRRRAAVQGAALLLGFTLVTAPYVAALSRHFGELTVIDTHGSIHVDAGGGPRAPGLAATAGGLWREVTADPSAFANDTLARARSLLHVNGGRILQIYIVAGSKATAAAWKTFVHAGSDGLLVIGAVAAALGAAVCRGRPLAAMLLLWTAVNVAVASVGGFSGARLRTPFEPMLYILAAVLCARGWQRPAAPALAGAVALGAAAAAAVLPQVPRSLQSWPDYGVRWPSVFSRESGSFQGPAGLNVLAPDGVAVVTLTSPADSPDLQVRVGGVHVRTLRLVAGRPDTVRLSWPPRGLAFVELQIAPSPGSPPTLEHPVHIAPR